MRVATRRCPRSCRCRATSAAPRRCSTSTYVAPGQAGPSTTTSGTPRATRSSCAAPGLAPADVVDDRVEGESGVLVAVRHEEQAEPGGVEDLGDGVEHRQRGRVAEGGAEPTHGDAHDAAATAAQVAGQGVGTGVAQGSGSGQHPVARLRGDRLVAGEGQGGGGERHARGSGDVGHGGGSGWTGHVPDDSIETIRSKRFARVPEEQHRAHPDRRAQRRGAHVLPQRAGLRQLGLAHPRGAVQLRPHQRSARPRAARHRAGLGAGAADDRRRHQRHGHRADRPHRCTARRPSGWWPPPSAWATCCR